MHAIVFQIGSRRGQCDEYPALAGILGPELRGIGGFLAGGLIGKLASSWGFPAAQPGLHEHRYYGSEGLLLLDLSRTNLALRIPTPSWKRASLRPYPAGAWQ